NRSRYENWLLTQRPFLATLPPPALHGYEFTIIHDHSDRSTIRPIMNYYTKAGDWDGLLNLTFVIEIDAQRRPVRLLEQMTFIGLPAGKIVLTEDGRSQTREYYGIILKPTAMAELVARAVRGDDFDDLRNLAAQRGSEEWVVTRPEDSDDWIKL